MYRSEYLNFLSQIYEETDYELSERLLVKKLLLLLLHITLGEDCEDWKAAKLMSKSKSVNFPKVPILIDLYKMCLDIIKILDDPTKKESFGLANLFDKIIQIEKGLIKQPLIKSGVLSSKKKAHGLNSDSSHVDDDDDVFEDSMAEEEDDKDDFGIVPANNMDNETVHIKILDDDVK